MRNWRFLLVPLLLAVTLVSPRAYPSRASDSTALPWIGSTVAVGANPRGIAIDETHNLIYVANHVDNTISKIDGASLAMSTFSNQVSRPIGLAYRSATNQILAANNDQLVMSIIGAGGALDASPGVGANSYNVAFNASNGKSYVTSFDSSVLYRINPDNSVLAIGLPGKPVWVALNPGLERAYVTLFDRQSVVAINTTTDAVAAEFTGVYGNVSGIAVDPTNNYIYVSNAFEGAVTVIDKDGNLVGILDVGSSEAPAGQPRGVAVNPNTGHIFVNRYDNNQVYVFARESISGGAKIGPIAQIAVPAAPEFGIGVNTVTNKVYVASSVGNTVSVINDLLKTIQLSTNNLVYLSLPEAFTRTQTVIVNNIGLDPMAWTAEVSPGGTSWLTASPISGTTAPANLGVTVNAAPGGVPLALNTYQAHVIVTAQGAGASPQTIDVKLVVTDTIYKSYKPAEFKASGW